MNKIFVLITCYITFALIFSAESILHAASPTPTPAAQTQTSLEKSDKECSCPDIEVYSNWTQVKSGDEIEFSVEILDDNLRLSRFNWKVENGRIISGQGTDEIVVVADQKGNAKSVKATVEVPVYSSLCVCPITFSHETRFGELSYIETPNLPANVTDLMLDENLLILPCHYEQPPSKNKKASQDMIIEVQTLAKDPENDVLIYNYKVSGGRIIGTGRLVQWDLTGAFPGTYSITAGVDDGCGVCGETRTRTVTVEECDPTSEPADCPQIELQAPQTLANNGEFVFTANVSGGSPDITYEWSVENGEIVGQKDGPFITIKAPTDVSQKKVVVTMNILGFDPIWNCITQRSLTYIDGKLSSMQ